MSWRKATSNSEAYTTYTRPVDIKKLAFIHRHLDDAGARKLLELGCGTGAIAMSLVAQNRQIKAFCTGSGACPRSWS
jgi:cyclopropane fatty-acyl-phospholipid synthase-like methyltransferase